MAAYPDPGFSPALTTVWLVAAAMLFPLGWSISPGANLQNYTLKRWPDRKILYSGFWGVARHFNYMDEGFLSLSIALVFGHFGAPWAWTYFLFIVTMLTFRQRDDDRHCAEKWAEYQARVKYRIFPGVY